MCTQNQNQRTSKTIVVLFGRRQRQVETFQTFVLCINWCLRRSITKQKNSKSKQNIFSNPNSSEACNVDLNMHLLPLTNSTQTDTAFFFFFSSKYYYNNVRNGSFVTFYETLFSHAILLNPFLGQLNNESFYLKTLLFCCL